MTVLMHNLALCHIKLGYPTSSAVARYANVAASLIPHGGLGHMVSTCSSVSSTAGLSAVSFTVDVGHRLCPIPPPPPSLRQCVNGFSGPAERSRCRDVTANRRAETEVSRVAESTAPLGI
jgi:hypothetical protein